jgi:hypothetical protein
VCDCQTTPVPEYRWLGVRWMGVPFPVRLAGLWWGIEDIDSWPGCGCAVWLRAWWGRFVGPD